MLDLEEELRRIVDAFDAAAVPYALSGGLALAVHGHPRATIDVDLLVREDFISRAQNLARSLTTAGEGDALGVTLTPQTMHAWSCEMYEWSGREISVVPSQRLAGPFHCGHCSAGGEEALRSIDYSDKAITQRIRQVSQLRKLCLSLMKAKPVAEKPKS